MLADASGKAFSLYGGAGRDGMEAEEGWSKEEMLRMDPGRAVMRKLRWPRTTSIGPL